MPVDDKNACTDDVCDNDVPVSKPTAAGSPFPIADAQCDGSGACLAPMCAGTSGYMVASSTSVGKSPGAVVGADLNGDGKPDLAVTILDVVRLAIYGGARRESADSGRRGADSGRRDADGGRRRPPAEGVTPTVEGVTPTVEGEGRPRKE